MNDVDINSLQEDDSFFRDVGSNVWLMDDHRWSFYIWQRFHASSRSKRFSLVHADYHWDGLNDFRDRPAELEELQVADDARLLELVRENNLITYDSFIAPAVLRGFIDEVHFYCTEDEGSDEGLDKDLLMSCDCRQQIHADYKSLSTQQYQSPIIFDLCIDLFNRSKDWYESDIWSDEETEQFLSSVMPLIESAALVTISMSFGYSGTADDTRRLTKIVLPQVLDCRS